MASPEAPTQTLRIAAWNLEHLNEEIDTGCIQRTASDYATLKERVATLRADVVAFQEVENAAAAHRVFPKDEWQVVMSQRPDTGVGNECWDTPGQHLRHLGTGFAVKHGIKFIEKESLASLSNEQPFQRWGTDISLPDHDLRLLSVHFASGCWGAPQDDDERRARTCATLRHQMSETHTWIAERVSIQERFIVLGDFNRRLAVAGDWGWELLKGELNSVHLATRVIETECDPRFDEIIDHIVLSRRLIQDVVAGSVREYPRVHDHPDHCAFSVDLSI